MITTRLLSISLASLFLSLSGTTHAQWVNENYPLVAGWNAIWLSHNASHDTIGNLVDGRIEEIWRWNPGASPTQFTETPSAPVQPDTQWMVWKNGFPSESTMTTFGDNTAYLVKVADGTPNFTLTLTGRPVPPSYEWKSSGVNFFGFPMKTPDSVGDRNFETFFSYSGELSAGPDIFRYTGGPITSNPVRVTTALFEPVSRGRAYWIRSTQYSDYYGPLRVTIGGSGLAYGDSGNILTLTITNTTSAAVTATLTPAASATPPDGQAPVAGQVPLRLRSGLNPTTAQFDYLDFSAATPFTLAAGQEIEVIFAVDRAAMGGSPGDLFQSILQITDSENISRIDLPVSAATTSRAGLWVGTALVTNVDQISAANRRLSNVAGDLLFLSPDGTTTTENTGVPAYETTANAEGIIDVATDANAEAPASFGIRLIVHRNSTGGLKLLQKVFVGENTSGTTIITTNEAALDPAKLATARRLSSASLPIDLPILGSGSDLGLTGTASFSSVLGYNHVSNPFVHKFHPDHDNKDAQDPPATLPEGNESYTVSRAIGLTFIADPATLGLIDLGWGSTSLGGVYTETITGLRAQPITVQGSFVLRRVSSIEDLAE